MKIIVVGYGRVGTQVVRLLSGQDHSIMVIDKNRSALEKAVEDAHAKVLIGDCTDPDMMRKAGAEDADVLLALTREENTNLMAAQIARVAFRVPKAIAMIYDPQREQTFHAAGIDTLQITVSGAELLVSQMGLEAVRMAERMKESATAVSPAIPVPVRPFPASGPYYVIIMGGGKVGYYLGRTLLEEGHEIAVIENDPEIYGMVSRQLDCPVILGDGSTYSVLEKAGAKRCNVFVAVTNHDQDNLIGCEVAKLEFGVPKTISRVKNPKNEAIMQQLGVDVTVSSTAIISSLIESELPTHKIRMLLSLRAGQLEIMEYVLDGNSPVVGHQLKELTMPPQCNIVTILRDGDAVV
ncbi:MAG: NAD-binding protein, partial [Acidobacteria bacterium]|nr:NAD-binding protein [Acidobacteriota bacterium]